MNYTAFVQYFKIRIYTDDNNVFLVFMILLVDEVQHYRAFLERFEKLEYKGNLFSYFSLDIDI